MFESSADVISDTLSVLLIEDSDDVRYLVGSILSQERRVRILAEAGDGARGVVAAEEHQPDVIVLDIGLPGRSGLDVLPALRDAAPRARVIVLSGDHRPELNAAVIAKGAFAYVAKRDVSSRLMTVVRSLLGPSTTPESSARSVLTATDDVYVR